MHTHHVREITSSISLQVKNASCEFILYKLIALIIVGSGNNLCLWGMWKESVPGYITGGKKLLSMVEGLFDDSFARMKCAKFVTFSFFFTFIFVNF